MGSSPGVSVANVASGRECNSFIGLLTCQYIQVELGVGGGMGLDGREGHMGRLAAEQHREGGGRLFPPVAGARGVGMREARPRSLPRVNLSHGRAPLGAQLTPCACPLRPHEGRGARIRGRWIGGAQRSWGGFLRHSPLVNRGRAKAGARAASKRDASSPLLALRDAWAPQRCLQRVPLGSSLQSRSPQPSFPQGPGVSLAPCPRRPLGHGEKLCPPRSGKHGPGEGIVSPRRASWMAS